VAPPWLKYAVAKASTSTLGRRSPSSSSSVFVVSMLVCALTEGQNTVTRVEVKMTDGKTHVSSSVPPDIAHIVSMMPPELFSPKPLPSQVRFVMLLTY